MNIDFYIPRVTLYLSGYGSPIFTLSEAELKQPLMNLHGLDLDKFYTKIYFEKVNYANISVFRCVHYIIQSEQTFIRNFLYNEKETISTLTERIKSDAELAKNFTWLKELL